MENNKEELKKLESQYNRYMKIIKFILLIVLFVFLIFATRFIYLYSIMSKMMHANHVDLINKNVKITYSYTYPDFPEEHTDIIHYFKDGVTVMEASFFKTYSIDDKIYNFYPSSEEKTYSVNEYDKGETWDNLSLFKKIAVTAVQAYSNFTTNISYEELNGEKCIVFTKGNSKDYCNSETFLRVREETPTSITYIKYEFDVVTDEDIKLPDLTEYVLDED